MAFTRSGVRSPSDPPTFSIAEVGRWQRPGHPSVAGVDRAIAREPDPAARLGRPEIRCSGLVFGAGTAVAAWASFGRPRISYGGYQTGLAFYKAILQGFGAAVTATVIRDRLIGRRLWRRR